MNDETQQDQETWHDDELYGDPRRVSPQKIVGAIAGSAVGGALGAVIWAFLVASMQIEIGVIALGLGALAGAGASLGSGRGIGLPYQIIAVVCTLVSFALAKLLAVVLMIEAPLVSLSSPTFVVEVGVATITEMASPFDILWIALAVGIAWKIPSTSL